MRFVRTFFCASAVCALAACGGGSGSVPPTAAGDAGTRGLSGTTVGFEKKTLWIAYETAVDAYSTNAEGSVAPKKTLGSFPWANGSIPGILDIAVAPDGTQWELEDRDLGEGGPGWRLNAVAPGGTLPENTDGEDTNHPFGLALAGDGVMVGFFMGGGVTVIKTYPYGASNAQPLRTWQSSSPVIGFASGNDGHLYVERPTGFDVYDPASTGCCPLRTITVTKPLNTDGPHGFAVGPDNSIYVVHVPTSHTGHDMYVNVYAPGSGTVARRIGPFPYTFDPLGYPPPIMVDAKNRLYVAANDQIERFGPDADGAATPQRTFSTGIVQYPVALAVGPDL